MFRRRRCTAAITVALTLTTACASAAPSDTALVSRPNGEEAAANGSSYHTTISGDGRFVTFMSDADNLVPGDANGQFDVFVRDVTRGTTVVASVAAGGTGTAAGRSAWPAVSANGRFVAFQSFASDLVSGDTNARADVFVRDLRERTTLIVSRAGGAPTRLGNGASYDPAVSADGRFVAFQSFASNLVRGDTNGKPDVFVRDIKAGTTTLVSRANGRQGPIANGGSDNPSISADGRFVAFESAASDLVRGDRNHAVDVFVRDLHSGKTSLVSRVAAGRTRSGDGASYMPSISADGRFVAFASRAANLVAHDANRVEDVFVRDMSDASTQLVSVRTAPGSGRVGSRTIYPSISADGRYVAFHSDAANIVPGDSNGNGDVFVRNLASGTTRIASTAHGDDVAGGNGYSGGPAISADGRFVAFASTATDLVSADTNGLPDIFRRRLG